MKLLRHDLFSGRSWSQISFHLFPCWYQNFAHSHHEDSEAVEKAKEHAHGDEDALDGMSMVRELKCGFSIPLTVTNFCVVFCALCALFTVPENTCHYDCREVGAYPKSVTNYPDQSNLPDEKCEAQKKGADREQGQHKDIDEVDLCPFGGYV